MEAWIADPGLNSEPSTGYQRAKERRYVRAQNSEGDSCQHGKRDAELGSRMSVQDHRDENNQIAQGDGEDGLPPVHPALDERRRQHVGRYVDR